MFPYCFYPHNGVILWELKNDSVLLISLIALTFKIDYFYVFKIVNVLVFVSYRAVRSQMHSAFLFQFK